jgi:hypothetical protein
MAAGLGYIEFNTGDVLTAAQANGYLASQVVMVFADAAARTSAITSPQEGMISYLKDTNATQYYSGSAWVSIGGGASPLTTKGDLYTYSTTDARLGVGTNGQILTADSAEATGLKWATAASGGVDWVSWTPTYGSFTIGNATVTSVKAQDGEMGYFFWRLVWGSTTSFTAGDVYFDLPYSALYGNTTFYGGIRDASAGTFYTLIGQTSSGGGTPLYLSTEKSDATYVTVPGVSSSVPITFATGDVLVITGAYPV